MFRSTLKLSHQFRIHRNTFLRSLTTETHAKDLLVNILGMQEGAAQKYVDLHNVTHLRPQRLQSTLQFFKERKYRVSDILKNPVLITKCNLKTWKNYYDYFIECGFTNVPIEHLVNFRKIRFKTIANLKRTGLMPKNNSVVKSLIKHLDISLADETKDLENDQFPLSRVHRTVTNRYLIKRLGATLDQLETINRSHKNVYNKSLKRLCENVRMGLEIGFTPLRIMRNPYILHADPSITRHTIDNIGKFLNCDIFLLMRNCPTLVGETASHIEEVYRVLKDNHIPDESILRYPRIFTLCTKTVRERLCDIKSTPETIVLLNNPNILQLIVSYHRAQSRMQFLQQVRLKCCCLRVIGFHESIFDNHIKEGKDVNKRVETENFIIAMLKCTKQDVNESLKQHPFYLYVPYVEIQQTYRFLKRQRFEDEHIVKVISILLYSQPSIEMVLAQIQADHYLSARKPRSNKTQILNLALYYLEKDHHFSGNGIWRMNNDEEFT